MKGFVPFDEVDPYNSNRVKGMICQEPSAYGELLITEVNGWACEQLIHCVPKIHYPFNKLRQYTWPAARRLVAYEKLDGTSVFGYSYLGPDGEKFVTYKLRLRPFLVNSKFGPFLDMWNEMLLKYDVGNEILRLGNLAFELWGSRNIHLIEYEESLEISLLFGRDQQGSIIPPDKILSSLPKPSILSIVSEWYAQNTSITVSYEDLQSEIQKKLRRKGDYFEGSEGAVWYLQKLDYSWTMLKMKPSDIEAIHMAPGESAIDYNSLLATCLNVFESNPELSLETLMPLLQEEYSEEAIEKSETRIQKALQQVNSEVNFRHQVAQEYLNMDVNYRTHPKDVLRQMGQIFPKGLMGRVYAELERIA